MTAARGGPGAEGERAQDFERKELSKNNYCLVCQKNTLAAIIKEKASSESWLRIQKGGERKTILRGREDEEGDGADEDDCHL